MTRMSNKSRIGLIAVALAGSMNLASSAFAADALPQGYQLASTEKTAKASVAKASAAMRPSPVPTLTRMAAFP
jgi:uncharacterized low-complexity protein